MQQHRWTDDGVDTLIALDHLAEAQHSDRLENVPYVVLGLPLDLGVDDPVLLS